MNYYNTLSSVRKPVQIIPLSEKLSESEKGKAWRQNNIDYFGNKTSFMGSIKSDFEKLYKLSQGYLDTSDYTYITNPLNTNSNSQRSYPARLRNYDIISPIVQMFLGEKSRRKNDPTVIAINSDILNVKELMYRDAVNQELDQLFINTINGYIDTGYISRELKNQEQLQSEIDSIKDEKAKTGSNSLQYIYRVQELKRKFRKAFNDCIVTAFSFSYKEVKFDDVKYSIHSPINCGYNCSEDTDYIEDGESAWIREYLTVSDIIDRYNDSLTKEEITIITNLDSDDIGGNTTTLEFSDTDIFLRSMLRDGKIHTSTKSIYSRSNVHEVLTVAWKSKVKIGRVTGKDIFGETYQFEVDENYKPLSTEEVDWTWVNQTWVGERIANKIYKNVRPLEYQRGKFDNPSFCKLPINGFNLSSRNYYAKSPVKKLAPYQEKYNVVHWHLEKVMNKNKDKLTILPKNLIPDSEDMDMLDMMYYADADGFLFIDEVDDSKLAELRAVQVLDLSLRDYIRYLYELLQFIKDEAESTLGITRQRKGQVYASDGKGTNEESIFRSAIISEEIFLEFEEFEERELQGLLDLSKYAWRKGKKGWFMDSSKRQIFLDIVGEDHSETEYSVLATTSRDDIEKLEAVRANVQNILQNKGKHNVAVKIIATDNIEEILDILEIEEERSLQIEQANIEKENEFREMELDQQERFHQDEINIKLYEIDSKLAMSQNTSVAMDKNADNDLKREDLQIKRDQLNIQREEIQSRERMNKDNNETALKNKVVGESKNNK